MNRARRCLTSVIEPITMSERRIPYEMFVIINHVNPTWCNMIHIVHTVHSWVHFLQHKLMFTTDIDVR